MTQQEREQAARAIFKTYEEMEAELSKIASKARELARKIDEAIEDDEKKFDLVAAINVYEYLAGIEGAQRVASKMNDMLNRVRIDGTEMDFSLLTNCIGHMPRDAKANLKGIEELMHSFD